MVSTLQESRLTHRNINLSPHLTRINILLSFSFSHHWPNLIKYRKDLILCQKFIKIVQPCWFVKSSWQTKNNCWASLLSSWRLQFSVFSPTISANFYWAKLNFSRLRLETVGSDLALFRLHRTLRIKYRALLVSFFSSLHKKSNIAKLVVFFKVYSVPRKTCNIHFWDYFGVNWS